MSHRAPHSTHAGRHSTPVEVVLRMLALKHLYGWSYEATEHWVNDSLVLRQFCRLGLHAAPDDTTLIRWAKLLQPTTLHSLLDRVVALAQAAKLTRGRKLRLDGTVVPTTIHYPSDSTLLVDGVRVLSRTLNKARVVLGEVAQQGRSLFRNRLRSAKQVLQQLKATTRQRSAQAEESRRFAYERLLQITQAMVGQASQVQLLLHQQASRTARRLSETLETFLPRVTTVIRQTSRRVLQGESVPAADKLVSLFEPETAIIRKGKEAIPTEFGRLVWLCEVEGGIVSEYRVLEGNPPEEREVARSLDHHLDQFARPPSLLAGDRGTFSPSNEAYAEQSGVKQIVLPQRGYKRSERVAHEGQGWFRRGKHWRAGIEGRISVLKRRYGLARCRYHGTAGMERWVGWG